MFRRIYISGGYLVPEVQEGDYQRALQLVEGLVSELPHGHLIGVLVLAVTLHRQLLVVVVEEPGNPLLEDSKALPGLLILEEEEQRAILEPSKPGHVLESDQLAVLGLYLGGEVVVVLGGVELEDQPG